MLNKLDAAPAKHAEQQIEFRRPAPEDGYSVNRLIADSPPLDTNSVYCNLLQCSYFADTCVVATQSGAAIGFTSAFLVPGKDDTLFVWQIVVSDSARGKGLAGKMLIELLRRPLCSKVAHIETSINPDNEASWQLFRNLADTLEAECTRDVLFESRKHFNGDHPDELLLKIDAMNSPFINKLQNNREQ